MDFYLNDENTKKRLIKEWKKYGSLVVAYDFDNTVFDFHNEGQSYDDVIELLRECKQQGAYLIVYTAREDDELQFLKEYLGKNQIPYDSINEGAPFLPFNGRKLYYNILLDDRAGLSSSYKCLKEVLNEIKQQQ